VGMVVVGVVILREKFLYMCNNLLLLETKFIKNITLLKHKIKQNKRNETLVYY
jgi:hypothetical protein